MRGKLVAGNWKMNGNLASNQSLTEGIAFDQHPNVLRASARVREAYLALKRVELLAPVDGYVARRNVQLGQRVQAGAPLLSVINVALMLFSGELAMIVTPASCSPVCSSVTLPETSPGFAMTPST